MAYTTIDDPSAYFNTLLYSGNAGTNALTNSANAGNFQPDWLWIKCRNSAVSHNAFDTSRQTSGESTLVIRPNSNDAESNVSGDGMTSIDSNGFTLNGGGSGGGVNESGKTYVAWQWKCNGGTTSTNNDGSVSVTLQTNSTAGFSIGTFTGTGNSSGTIGHGLGAKPDWLIVKRRDGSENWNNILPNVDSKLLRLNTADASFIGSAINSVGASTFTDGNGNNAVFYAFKSIQGYSKFGSYTGNGNADGPFVYTGFKPAWVMIKRINSSNNWHIHDNKRDTFNVADAPLLANTSDAELTNTTVDFLSNGFKLRTSVNFANGSEDYIYMAFAEHPFVSSKGVPTTAR